MYDHTKNNHVKQKLKCPECDFSKSPIARVKAHLYQVHLKIGTMKKCDQCDYKNVKGNNVYVHKRQNHMKNLKQKCSECDNTYYYPRLLKKHFKQVHLKMRRQNAPKNRICRKQICKDYQKQICKELENHSQFFCDQCPFFSRSKITTDSHIQFAHDGMVLKCDLCTECTVQTKSALERHMKLKHPGPGQKAEHLVCTEDGCSYQTVRGDSDMKRHNREKHEGLKLYNYNAVLGRISKREDFENGELLSCERCPYKTTIESAWRKHINKHFHSKHTCDKCDFSATSLDKLKKHEKDFHTTQIFSCKEFEFSDTSKENLQQHKENQHKEVKFVIKHEKCDLPKKSRDNCELPDESKFQNGDPQKCEKCDYKTAKFYNMRVHIRKVHFDLKHKCTDCDYSHLFLSMVKKHFKIKHSKSLLNKCDKVPDKSKFQNGDSQKCDECDNETAKYYTMQVHIRKVHFNTKHKCIDCDYSHLFLSGVKKHFIIKHSQILPHKCTVCDFSHLFPGLVKKHFKAKHLKIQPKEESVDFNPILPLGPSDCTILIDEKCFLILNK